MALFHAFSFIPQSPLGTGLSGVRLTAPDNGLQGSHPEGGPSDWSQPSGDQGPAATSWGTSGQSCLARLLPHPLLPHPWLPETVRNSFQVLSFQVVCSTRVDRFAGCNCVLPKFARWNLHPDGRTWLYLEKASSPRWLSLNEVVRVGPRPGGPTSSVRGEVRGRVHTGRTRVQMKAEVGGCFSS